MAKQEKMVSKTDEEISKLLLDSRAELRTERFSAAGSRAKSPFTLRKLRKTVARVLTEQHARTTKAKAN